MRRRDFIAVLGGAGASLPFAARAQQRSMPVVAFIHPSSIERNRDAIAAFEEGLRSNGHVVGRNVEIEYRWANDNYDRLPELVQELVNGKAAVILAGTPVAALAAKKRRTQFQLSSA
jgi:putative ABC transport system substrate-binding protein